MPERNPEQPAVPPPPPRPAPEEVLRAARLPRRLATSLAAELCPDEEVRFIAAPSPRRVRCLRWGAFLPAGLLAGTVLEPFAAGVASPAADWPLVLLAGALGALPFLWPRRSHLYAATNQRCFRLTLRGRRVRVQDLADPPADVLLEPRDALSIERQLVRLQEELGPAARARGGGGSNRRELPARLVEEVHRHLSPGEQLLWADRPNPRDYFMHAPLDGFCIVALLVALAAWPFALFAPAAKVSALLLAAALLSTLTFAGRLWRQIRGTVYALTERRGFVLQPGGQVTTYPLHQLRSFQRIQNARGFGRLEKQGTMLEDGVGFYGVRNVKALDDLIKNRTVREHASEVVPAAAPDGRGDEPAAS